MPDDFKTQSDKWIKQYERDPAFVAEGMATAFIEAVISEAEAQGQPAWFIRNLKAGTATPNTTLLTVARLALALGLTPRIVLERKGAASNGPPKERG